MAKSHLTDIVVQRLSKLGTYYDETTPASGIRIGKRGKTWIVIRGKERLRSTIGHYPAMGLAEARKEAKKLLAETAPSVRARTTFSTAYEAHKANAATLKPKTWAEYKRHLEKYFVPVSGKKKLAELEYEDVVGCIRADQKRERPCLGSLPDLLLEILLLDVTSDNLPSAKCAICSLPPALSALFVHGKSDTV